MTVVVAAVAVVIADVGVVVVGIVGGAGIGYVVVVVRCVHQ